MGKIIIKGNFTVETDYTFVNNFKQPISILEIEIPEIQPFKVNKIMGAGTVQIANNKGGESNG